MLDDSKMKPFEEYEGREFPVPDPSIGASCIDYWFGEDEVAYLSENNPLVPVGFKAIARDPGDDLILLANNGEIYYCNHENGRLVKLTENMAEFLKTISLDD